MSNGLIAAIPLYAVAHLLIRARVEHERAPVTTAQQQSQRWCSRWRGMNLVTICGDSDGVRKWWQTDGILVGAELHGWPQAQAHRRISLDQRVGDVRRVVEVRHYDALLDYEAMRLVAPHW